MCSFLDQSHGDESKDEMEKQKLLKAAKYLIFEEMSSV